MDHIFGANYHDKYTHLVSCFMNSNLLQVQHVEYSLHAYDPRGLPAAVCTLRPASHVYTLNRG